MSNFVGYDLLVTADTPTVRSYYDSARAADFCLCAVATLYAAVRKGELKAFRRGKALLFRHDDLVAWLEKQLARDKRGAPLLQSGARRVVAGAAAQTHTEHDHG